MSGGYGRSSSSPARGEFDQMLVVTQIATWGLQRMNFSVPASTGRRALPVMSRRAVKTAQESWVRVIVVASLFGSGCSHLQGLTQGRAKRFIRYLFANFQIWRGLLTEPLPVTPRACYLAFEIAR